MRKVLSIFTMLATSALGQEIPEVVESAPESKKGFLERLQYTGLVDVFGGGHFESADATSLRVFDTNGRGVQLSYAKVGAWFDADPVGFRFDVGFGQTLDVLSFDTTVPVLRQFEQAYVSGKVPLHRGITVDFGRFVTCAGNETVDSRQSWLYSRSLLFGYAAPFTHTGLRVTAPITDAWTVQVGAVQGWDVILDNNLAKSFYISNTFTPSSTQTFAVSVFGGPELTGDNTTWRWLADGVWTAKLPKNFDVSANVDGAIEGATTWYGAALSGHFAVNMFDFAARAEVFSDPQNARLHLAQAPGLGSWAWEATVSGRATLNKYLQFRLEYRHDQLYGAVSTPQDTVSLALAAGI